MTKSTGKYRQWTSDDQAQAVRLYRELQSYLAVARIMNRSPNTIRSRILGLHGAHMARVVPEGQMHIPAEVLEDRERRYRLAPRDLTAAIFGDPKPGYSALERR